MGKLRLIGGKWRSRVLPVLDLPGLRPTTDRVRETLFNWLQNDIPGARCLDLFAGSGALGFEAASRGAESVLMLELQGEAAKTLASNIVRLQAVNVQLQRQDAMTWLRSEPKSGSFDIVFIDPPFDSDYLSKTCELLDSQQLLSPEAFIYLEMNRKQTLPELPKNWTLCRQKKAGQVGYYLAKYTDNKDKKEII